MALQEVVEGALFVELGNEPQLHVEIVPAPLCPNETEDVVVVVDRRHIVHVALFSEGLQLLQGEYLDRDCLVIEVGLPDATEPSGRLDLLQLYGTQPLQGGHGVARVGLRGGQGLVGELVAPVQPERQDHDEGDGYDRHQAHDHGRVLDVGGDGELVLLSRGGPLRKDGGRVQLGQAVA